MRQNSIAVRGVGQFEDGGGDSFDFGGGGLDSFGFDIPTDVLTPADIPSADISTPSADFPSDLTDFGNVFGDFSIPSVEQTLPGDLVTGSTGGSTASATSGGGDGQAGDFFQTILGGLFGAAGGIDFSSILNGAISGGQKPSTGTTQTAGGTSGGSSQQQQSSNHSAGQSALIWVGLGALLLIAAKRH